MSSDTPTVHQLRAAELDRDRAASRAFGAETLAYDRLRRGEKFDATTALSRRYIPADASSRLVAWWVAACRNRGMPDIRVARVGRLAQLTADLGPSGRLLGPT